MTVSTEAPAVIEIDNRAYEISVSTVEPKIEVSAPETRIIEVATAGIQGPKGDKGDDGAFAIASITTTDIEKLF